MYDHESLVTAIKSADVVISAVGYQQLPDQTLIISAIKEVGHVKVISKVPIINIKLLRAHTLWLTVNTLADNIVRNFFVIDGYAKLLNDGL